MKTTIEVNGITILIESSEESINISASKDGEVIEDMSIEFEESQENENMEDAQSDMEDQGGMDVKGFEEFDDIEDVQSEIEVQGQDISDEDIDFSPKLENFDSFFKNKK